jgi:trk system potassium uptake protein TrkH
MTHKGIRADGAGGTDGLGPRPAKTLVAGFALLILAGTVLLALPVSRRTEAAVNTVDALFTATSAVCVTGLTSVDTAETWSPFGQTVILLLMQMGGLGIMTFSTFLLLSFGGRLSIMARETTGGALGVGGGPGLGPTLRGVFAFTLVFELAGAALLGLAWTFHPAGAGWGAAERLWHAAFHSVSAFCNAGFSTFGADSLSAFADSYATNLVVMALVVSGGLGFVVLLDIRRRHFDRARRSTRLSTHTRLAITVTALLIPLGALLVFLCEMGNDKTLAHLSGPQALMACLFQSVTARTAGFNTLNQAMLTPGALFVTLLLMFIGASPCGTGGGVKTTTLGIIVATAWARLTGREGAECFGRSVPRESVTRASSLLVSGMALVAAFVLVILISGAAPAGRDHFVDVLFEVVSAFGTVGLSTGVTGKMDTHGKLLVALLMLIGRVGPLSVAVALCRASRRQLVRLPEGNILVG